MKNKSNILKVIFIFMVVLLILFLITILSLLKFFFIKDKHENTKRIIESKYNLNNYDELIFDFKRANVVFKTTNDDNLIIVQNTMEDKLYLNVNKNQNQFYVEEDSNLFDESNKKFTIKIPKSFNGIIKIYNSFGELNIYNIKSNLLIDNNSGKMNVFRSKNINIKDVSGTINLDEMIGNIVISSSTGDINIKGIEGKININTLTGNVTVKNFKIEDNSLIENISGDIIVTINKDSICKINASNENGKIKINNDKCVDKKNLFEIKNVTGNINIK